jgi:hypothetical protein
MKNGNFLQFHKHLAEKTTNKQKKKPVLFNIVVIKVMKRSDKVFHRKLTYHIWQKFQKIFFGVATDLYYVI